MYYTMMFEGDENKNLRNIEVHGIDFVRAKEIWAGEVLEIPSTQFEHGEERVLAIGIIGPEEWIITVVFVWRGDRRRLISARRARNYERKIYQETFERGS